MNAVLPESFGPTIKLSPEFKKHSISLIFLKFLIFIDLRYTTTTSSLFSSPLTQNQVIQLPHFYLINIPFFLNIYSAIPSTLLTVGKSLFSSEIPQPYVTPRNFTPASLAAAQSAG